ncbi:DUF1772 domain-containing protein [Streptomyces sp. NPDC048172]|uniref:anthrone oxygenase family protein n=1 Tax=Streptomyces sp. NPDC048172 TaxID=3365505 RepID=UPI00370FF7AE
MLRALQSVSLMAATLTTGLSAGLYYGFTFAVMPGLRRASDRTFVETMQKINDAILNGWFMLLFMGSLLFILAAGGLHLAGDRHVAVPWIVAGLVLYVAVLAITIAGNVPLNDALVAGGLPDDASRLAELRADFEDTWNRWNGLRTAANTAAFASLAWALVRHSA